MARGGGGGGGGGGKLNVTHVYLHVSILVAQGSSRVPSTAVPPVIKKETPALPVFLYATRPGYISTW